MCGCDNQPPISRNGAGAIAIIHASSESSATRTRQLRLFFSNPTNLATDFTQVILGSEDVRDLCSHPEHSSLSLKIHNHGDLTSSVSSLASEASVSTGALHVLRFRSTDSMLAVAELSQRLDLGVGGEGVIGKMVSVSCNHRDLGHGIIGWN